MLRAFRLNMRNNKKRIKLQNKDFLIVLFTKYYEGVQTEEDKTRRAQEAQK
jgi:hypothetical protein